MNFQQGDVVYVPLLVIERYDNMKQYTLKLLEVEGFCGKLISIDAALIDRVAVKAEINVPELPPIEKECGK